MQSGGKGGISDAKASRDLRQQASRVSEELGKIIRDALKAAEPDTEVVGRMHRFCQGLGSRLLAERMPTQLGKRTLVPCLARRRF